MARFRLRLGLAAKFNFGIILVLLITGGLIALATSQIVARALANEYKKRGTALCISLSSQVREVILSEDLLRLKNIIDVVMSSGDDVLYAFFLSDDGRVLSHSFGDGFPVQLLSKNRIGKENESRVLLLTDGRDLIYDFATPVLAGPYRVGTVRLGLLHTTVERTISGLLWTVFAFIGSSVLIAYMIGAGMASRLTRQLRRMLEASHKILQGNFDVQVGEHKDWGYSAVIRGEADACREAVEQKDACMLLGTHPENGSNGSVFPEVCLECEAFYKHPGDELERLADSFDIMAFSLKRNISKLAESKKILEISEEKYRRIFETSMDMLFIADPKGRFLDVNRSGLRILGYDGPGEVAGVIGMDDILVEPRGFDALAGEFSRAGYVRDKECLIRSKAGDRLNVLLSGVARRDEEGRVLEYEGIIKDITHRKQMEQSLIRTEKLASMGQLAAGFAHEINNPLGLILGYTQLLLREEKHGGQRAEDLKTIEKHTKNCKDVVQSLLNFSRKAETPKARLDINELVSSVVEVVRHSFEMEKVEIVLEPEDGLPEVLGDGEKLQQVLMNLLINARQAIKAPGSVFVSTGRSKRGGEVVIRVRDTGAGIEPDIVNKIFDPFFTTKPTGQGTGLGLSVSYGIVKEHGGEIRVRSAPGEGSEFLVQLPVE